MRNPFESITSHEHISVETDCSLVYQTITDPEDYTVPENHLVKIPLQNLPNSGSHFQLNIKVSGAPEKLNTTYRIIATQIPSPDPDQYPLLQISKINGDSHVLYSKPANSPSANEVFLQTKPLTIGPGDTAQLWGTAGASDLNLTLTEDEIQLTSPDFES